MILSCLRQRLLRVELLDAGQEIEGECHCDPLLLKSFNRLIEFQEMRTGGRLATGLLEHLKVVVGVLDPQHVSGTVMADLPANRLQMRQEEQSRLRQFAKAGFDLGIGGFGRLLWIVEREPERVLPPIAIGSSGLRQDESEILKENVGDQMSGSFE